MRSIPYWGLSLGPGQFSLTDQYHPARAYSCLSVRETYQIHKLIRLISYLGPVGTSYNQHQQCHQSGAHLHVGQSLIADSLSAHS